jgi:hypothetical protein
MSDKSKQSKSVQLSNLAKEADRVIPKKQVVIFMYIRPLENEGPFGGIARGAVGAANRQHEQERQRNQRLQASLHTEKALPIKAQVVMKEQPTLEQLIQISHNNKP